MRSLYKKHGLTARWTKPPLLSILIALGQIAQAQEGSSGNTTIFNGAEMTFFGDHNFTTGGGGTQPGVIYTIRTAPFGILNFAASASVATGGDDANYVDGYVRKFGTSSFIFPVGDNAHYGPFAAAADGTMGSYFFVNPTTAVTSMLPSGDYPVLPTGGPFPSATFEATLESVSTIEYWDIDGSNATNLTLTWDAASDISGLTASQLNKLTIAGWNGSQWVAIPSKVDLTSILGGTSDLTAGSITTAAPLAPDTYTAYTFASRVTPLPVTLARFEARPEGYSAVLYWTTTEETNSDRFDIERSNNGKSWATIGSITSHGESKIALDYDFTDHNPADGENLYRLKMVDLDGSFAYSRVRTLRFERGGATVYPNPATDKLYFNGQNLVGKVRIINPSGKVVLEAANPIDGIRIGHLLPGLYLVEVTSLNGVINSQKVIVGK